MNELSSLEYTDTPWKVEINDAYYTSWVIRGGRFQNKLAVVANYQNVGRDNYAEGNANFIVTACNSYKKLIAEVEKLKAENARLRETLESYLQKDGGDYPAPQSCREQEHYRPARQGGEPCE